MEIEDFEDYLIYEDGGVFSKKRNKFLKPHKDNKGYIYVALFKDNVRKAYKVHRLLALNYIPNPENKPCVDHINRIRDDNRLVNLRWATRSENCRNCTMQKNNTSGYPGIYKQYSPSCKQGFIWTFEAQVDEKRKLIKSSVDFDKLKEFAIKWKKDNNYNF